MLYNIGIEVNLLHYVRESAFTVKQWVNDRIYVLRNRVVCVTQEDNMSRNNESVDMSAIFEAIKEAKSSLEEILDDIEDYDELKETVSDELSFSGLDVSDDIFDEEFEDQDEAEEFASKVLRDHVIEPLMYELKECIINFVDNAVWYHEDRLGNWMDKVSKYSVLQGIVSRAKSEDYNLEKRHDHYEEFNGRVESVLRRLRKTIMAESDGQIVLDPSFKNCDVTIDAEESLEALDALYNGEGWIQKFMEKIRKEEKLSDSQVDNILECETDYDDDDTEIEIWKISETMLEYEYESVQQNIEFYPVDQLENMVDDLICVKTAKEYKENLEAFLRERFALLNEKIQELRFDVSW
jgi:hypothetical protein